jgi:hypothetical protein
VGKCSLDLEEFVENLELFLVILGQKSGYSRKTLYSRHEEISAECFDNHISRNVLDNP